METQKLTMSHAIWAQRTPRMAYNMQGITMFHVAWKRGWSPVGLKMLRGWAFCTFGRKFNIYCCISLCKNANPARNFSVIGNFAGHWVDTKNAGPAG
jgi:hypothetical protein